MTRDEARQSGTLIGYVLCQHDTHPPKYLRDYRYIPMCLVSADEQLAEVFARKIDADEMAHRLEWITRLHWDVVPTNLILDKETCCTYGCDKTIEQGRMHCANHKRPWQERLRDHDIDEAAFHAALEDESGSLLEEIARHFETDEECDDSDLFDDFMSSEAPLGRKECD